MLDRPTWPRPATRQRLSLKVRDLLAGRRAYAIDHGSGRSGGTGRGWICHAIPGAGNDRPGPRPVGSETKVVISR